MGAYHRAFATGGTVADARSDALAESDVFLAAVGTLQPGELLPVDTMRSGRATYPTENGY